MAPSIITERKSRPRKQVELPQAVQSRAFAQYEEIQKSFRYLFSVGISQANVARALGASRRQVHEWAEGRYCPQQPLIAFTIIFWAEHVRNRQAWSQFLDKVNSQGEHNGQ